MNLSKTDKLLHCLSNGRSLTSKEISSYFGLSSPRSAIFTLRNEGFRIKHFKKKNSRGHFVSRYRLVG